MCIFAGTIFMWLGLNSNIDGYSWFYSSYARLFHQVSISNRRLCRNFSLIKDSIFLAAPDRLMAALAESLTDQMNSLGVHGSKSQIKIQKEVKCHCWATFGHKRSKAPEMEIWVKSFLTPSGLDQNTQHGHFGETRFPIGSKSQEQILHWACNFQTVTYHIKILLGPIKVQSVDAAWSN